MLDQRVAMSVLRDPRLAMNVSWDLHVFSFDQHCPCCGIPGSTSVDCLRHLPKLITPAIGLANSVAIKLVHGSEERTNRPLIRLHLLLSTECNGGFGLTKVIVVNVSLNDLLNKYL